MKKQLFTVLLIAISLLIAHRLYKLLTKPQNPFIKYANLIPGTYRLGFTNLEHEVSNVALPITGTIPDWLSGTLLRNGPAKFYTNSSWVSNWFDGLAMIHAFTIANGTVNYSNKFLRSNAYEQVEKTGSMNYIGFMQDPCGSIFKRLFSWFLPKKDEDTPALHNTNVNIALYTNRMIALTEIPLPVEFDPQTLETLGVYDYQDQLPKDRIHDTPHPHYDPITQEHLGYFTQFGRMSTVNLFAIADGSSTRRIIGSYQVQEPSYMHSFAITKNYAILTALPLVVNPLNLLKGKGFIQSFTWKPELGTRFVIFNRHTRKQVGTIIGEPFFAFHTVNAFERDYEIVLDIITYKNAAGLDEAKFDAILGPQNGQASSIAQGVDDDAQPSESGKLKRFVLNLEHNTATSNIIVPDHVELPRINYAYNGAEYTYVYSFAQSNAYESYAADKLLKINVINGDILTWKQPDCYPGEPVFVAHPQSSQEDDGVVMSVVLDVKQGASFLLILDARTFTEVARAYAPHHIPFGIHGSYTLAPLS